MMNLREYNKFVEITNLLTISKTPGLLFQNFVEEQINNVEYNKFFSSNKEEPKKYIRLNNPECRNTKDRGLKICLKNDSILKEKMIKVNSILFKFEPLVKVIGLYTENCSQCCKSIEPFGKSQVNNKIVVCDKCNIRQFCSQDCKLQAMLEWHDLECDFINFIKKELILKKATDVNNDSNKIEQYFEKIILILVTTFRLLVKLIRCDPKILDIVINMSDHINLYKKYITTGSCECKEQEEIFEDTKRTFGPLFVLYFQIKRKENEINQNIIKDLNKDGICRALFLVFINVSSLMDASNNNNNIGLLFDPIFSMINHSCNPNSTLIWKDNGEVLVKNIKELKSTDEIFINYIPIQMPKEMRQIQLKNSFFFNCECSKCLITDNEFDSMLPINCNNCSQNNFGFKLENFEDSKMTCNKIQVCNNCESIIDNKIFFSKYLEIFELFKLINDGNNKGITKLEDLSNWSLEPENIFKMNKTNFNKCILILKQSYGILPINSWPMIMLLNIIKIRIQTKEPFNLNVLRLTFLINLFGEFFKANNGLIETNIGIILYDLCIISSDYLFEQYIKFKNKIDKDIIEILGKGTFAMCILSFKYLQKRFNDSNNETKDYQSNLEKNEQDMINLSNEIKRLIEHYLNENENEGKMGYFQDYNQFVFEKSLNFYEKYLNCSDYVQLRELILELDVHDYDVFGIGRSTDQKHAGNGKEKKNYCWLKRNKNSRILPVWVAQL